MKGLRQILIALALCNMMLALGLVIEHRARERLDHDFRAALHIMTGPAPTLDSWEDAVQELRRLAEKER